jgi:hypothetical protein
LLLNEISDTLNRVNKFNYDVYMHRFEYAVRRYELVKKYKRKYAKKVRRKIKLEKQRKIREARAKVMERVRLERAKRLERIRG